MPSSKRSAWVSTLPLRDLVAGDLHVLQHLLRAFADRERERDRVVGRDRRLHLDLDVVETLAAIAFLDANARVVDVRRPRTAPASESPAAFSTSGTRDSATPAHFRLVICARGPSLTSNHNTPIVPSMVSGRPTISALRNPSSL